MESVTMSSKELRKLEVVQLIERGVYTQGKGSAELGMSRRQVIRLCQRYRTQGPPGLIHQSRGGTSNRRIENKLRSKIRRLTEERYQGFGPTLICEMLAADVGINISREWLRRFLAAEGLWKPRKRKEYKVYSRRNRRPREGELVQIDGSYHDWFEGRAPTCCLLVFIDDATGKLQELQFVDHESTEGYLESMERYIHRLGLPLSLYSDRHSVFKVNNCKRGEVQDTQFQRAMKELGIELIHANSPQAKGRVERSNGTLQDRLPKMMRLQGLCSMAEGNEYLEEFRQTYNKRFARLPGSAEDAHRSVPSSVHLSRILVKKETRKVSKDLVVQYRNRAYQLITKTPRRLVGQVVTVYEQANQEVAIECQDGLMEYTLFTDRPLAGEPMDRKQLDAFLTRKQPLSIVQRRRKGYGVNF